MCGGGGNGGVPIPPQDRCPIEISVIITDILHSGNATVWGNDVQSGDEFVVEPDPDDHTLKVLFEGVIVGRIHNVQVYKCITEQGLTYKGIVVNKNASAARLVRA